MNSVWGEGKPLDDQSKLLLNLAQFGTVEKEWSGNE